jgi:hypothetical protein
MNAIAVAGVQLAVVIDGRRQLVVPADCGSGDRELLELLDSA